LLLEARDRFGGRAWYRPFPGTDKGVELGGSWFDTATQAPLREEIERYGTRVMPAARDSATRWFTGGVCRDGLPVPPEEIGSLERALVAVIDASRRIRPDQPLESQRVGDLDVSVTDWVMRLGVPPATRDFLFGWAGLMNGVRPEEGPALGILYLIATAGHRVTSMFTKLAERFGEGTSSLVDAIAADLRGDVRLSAPVVRIAQVGSTVTVSTADGMTHDGGCAILAVPLNTIANIEFDPALDDDRMAGLKQGQLCRAVKVWALVEHAPQGLLGVGWGGPLYWVSSEDSVGDYQLVVGFGCSGDEAVNASDPRSVEQALHRFAPGARVLAVASHDWNADPWSRGGWMTEPVGWASSGLLERLARPHGRVIFAGSDIASHHAGWIACAIASGREAAAQSVRQLAHSA
jgi:monoamine oxidase